MTDPYATPEVKPQPRRLHRSSRDRMLGGVCGGIAEHLDIDPTLVRILAVAGAFVSLGTALVAYLVCWVVIPEG